MGGRGKPIGGNPMPWRGGIVNLGTGLRGQPCDAGPVRGVIVNRGGATHADVLALMDMTRERVDARFGVTLEPNIRMLGLRGAVAEAEPLALTAR